MSQSGFDATYAAIIHSRVYEDAVRAAIPGVPEWFVPFSITNGVDLAQFATALGLSRGDAFVDLACGMGGPGLWVAERTGAALTGVDFSPAAIGAARDLAAARSIDATFVVADATQTGLPEAAFAGVMSIDSIQFIDANAIAGEIARLLRRGGIAVIRTWEALVDEIPLPTIVRDYAPIFERAGLTVTSRHKAADFRERELPYYRELVARETALRNEIGGAAESLLEEAHQGIARASLPPRVRKITLVARKR